MTRALEKSLSISLYERERFIVSPSEKGGLSGISRTSFLSLDRRG
jgi:hypothetical protein